MSHGGAEEVTAIEGRDGLHVHNFSDGNSSFEDSNLLL